MFVQALGWRSQGVGRDAPCSGEILGGDVECVHMLLGGFTGPCRGLCRSRCVIAGADRPGLPFTGVRAANAYSLGDDRHTFGGVLCVK